MLDRPSAFTEPNAESKIKLAKAKSRQTPISKLPEEREWMSRNSDRNKMQPSSATLNLSKRTKYLAISIVGNKSTKQTELKERKSSSPTYYI
mmetsp:Transcript_35536/g.41131  ORF Transcript_35536/g.41131 Transcript_35536/m.41131 type:complete len:92 (+) Transcript_35536:266-541(+)